MSEKRNTRGRNIPSFLPKPGQGIPPRLGPAVSLGSTLAAGFAIFAGAGYWIDQRRGGGQVFTLAGLFLALLYGAYEVYKVVKILKDPTDPGESEDDEFRS